MNKLELLINKEITFLTVCADRNMYSQEYIDTLREEVKQLQSEVLGGDCS